MISTTHFSFFGGLFADVGDVIKIAKKNIFDGLTSNFVVEAEPPTCESETEARSGGYSIGSDAKDTVNWCFGIEGGQRILRVVNRRRYPLSMSHPGLTTITEGHLNGLATSSRWGSGDRGVIAPREAMTFRVDAANGSTAVLHTEFDGLGQSLYQLQVGVQTALDLMTAFGFKATKSAVTVAAGLVGASDCATTLEHPTDAGSILSKCFGVGNMIRVLGTSALLVAPLMVASGLIEFFHSEFNAVGDQVSHRDDYSIRITSARAVTAGALELSAGGLGPLKVGITPEEASATGLITWGGWSFTVEEDGYQCGGAVAASPPFGEEDFGAIFSSDGLEQLIVKADQFRTRDGLGVGSSRDHVREVLGEPSESAPDEYNPGTSWDFFRYSGTGMGFAFDQGGIAREVAIGTWNGVHLSEGCV